MLVVLATVQLSVASVDEAWQKHVAGHNLKFKSNQEHEFRKNLFKTADNKIKAHNSIAGNQPLAHNKFSTMTDQEKSNVFGFVSTPSAAAQHRSVSFNLQETRALPSSVDLRTDKCMPPIKNQGQCGCCWTFSATATLEFNNCVKTGALTTLSEQQIVDCAGSNGCNGGNPTAAWNYIVGTGGQDKNSTYPFTGTYGSCKYSASNVGATVSPKNAVTRIASGDVQTAMTLLANRTAISVGITGADADSFMHYQKGTVFQGPCSTNPNAGHAINIVGYGTSNGIDYWIVRNSWDVTWGDSGYAMFKRGVNLCGIESSMSTTTASTGDVVQPVVWKNGISGFYSYSNCGYAGTVISYSTASSTSMTLDTCGNNCAGSSTCNYFTFSGTTCTFLTFASSPFKPVAYIDSTQSCGSVISRPTFNWTTSGQIQYSSNCDMTIQNGSWNTATVPGTATLAQCLTYCSTTYPSYCSFFSLSTTGVCSLKTSSTKPTPTYSSTNSNCGWIPTKF